MATLLYIKASPRERSKSTLVAEAFIEAYRAAHPDDTVKTFDIFSADLPSFDGPTVQAKYAILHGEDHTPEQRKAWDRVEAIVAEFTAADKYLFSLPMWNFGIPYRLKQYIDILVQPGYTFSYSPEQGYTGLINKPAAAVYARGGDYSSKEAAVMDYQRPYLEAILGFMGVTVPYSIVVEPTLMGGAVQAQQVIEAAAAQAKAAGEGF